MAKVMDFNISNSTTYNSTTTVDEIQDWNHFSPVVDWESLSGNQESFENLLIDPKIDENESSDHFPSKETLIEEYTMFDDQDHEDLKGLKLIHLLTAAAEALTGPDKSRELAKVILVRLSELVSPHEGSTNMERLAAHFTDALQRLLDGPGCNSPRVKKARYKEEGRRHSDDFLAAFQLLQDGSPYIKFGHFTANQSILEAVASDQRVHIVDFDIMEGVQWASLMQALVSRRDGPSGPHLRITALSRSIKNGQRPSGCSVQETGRRLTAFAASMGQPFSFHQCRLDHDERFRPDSLKLVKGEALIVNCMLDLPHLSFRARDSIASFLSGMRALRPRLVALVEEEAGPVGTGGPFAGRFMDALHRYSTLYDSLEAGFPMNGRARSLVERVFLGPRIAESLGRIYRACGDGDECSWARWMGSAGFRPVEISSSNRCQAKLLLGLYNDGYKVEESCRNKLVLGWKSRRLLSASVWTSQDDDL